VGWVPASLVPGHAGGPSPLSHEPNLDASFGSTPSVSQISANCIRSA
jgi:hypothetical protein